ncbi:MAG: hypothetical protein EOO90_21755 [Pedobacter sp.]|nr:MAG: hypothetical protein EOO90_21755 [Pedobacter sp.]
MAKNWSKLLLIFIVTLGLNTFAQKPEIIMPDGHSLHVEKVLLDRQGKYLYTFEEQKCIMWDATSRMQLYTFRPGKIQDINISPDGKSLLILANGNIKLFSTVSGLLLKTTKGYNNYDGIIFDEGSRQIFSIMEGSLHTFSYDLEKLSSIKLTLSTSEVLHLLPNNKVLIISNSATHIYDPSSKSISAIPILNDGPKYLKKVYLPFQQWVAFYGNDIPIDFYDIRTGKKVGSIPGKRVDEAVIPSETSAEILVHNSGTSEGFYSLDLYSTETFKPIEKFSNVNSKKYHSIETGYFDGKNKYLFCSSYNQINKFDLKNKQNIKFDGYAASLGMDVFNSIQYHPATGRLHLNTNDVNLKSVDLYRMVPIAHTNLKTTPSALSVSVTGDTIAIFNEDKLTVKNIKKNVVIRPPIPLSSASFLNRESFFFDNDGKNFWFGTKVQSDFKLIKANTATGVNKVVLNLSGLGPAMVLGDQSLMAGFETGYRVNNAKVWDLKTGKALFEKALETDGNYDEQYIGVSTNKDKVIIAKNLKLLLYDINGQQLSTSEIGFIDKFGASTANNKLSLFATGNSAGELTVYQTNGNVLYKFQAHNSTIRKIVFSPDDKLMYTISLDNTIKVWKVEDGKLIGTLYLFKESNDFIFMDEAGRFDGTPEGMKKVYYVTNRQSMPLGRLFERYYTPSLYARAVAGEQFDPIPVDFIKPAPKVKINYAAIQRNLEVSDDKPVYKNSTGFAEITVIASAEADKVDEIRLFHNEKIVTLTTRNLIVADDNAANTTTKKYQVNLLPGNNSIRALALNSQRTESEPDQITVNYLKDGAVTPTIASPMANTMAISKVDKSATLHLIVVGINAYKNTSMSLNYAIADATGFKDELEKNVKSVISTTKTYFVKDGDANKAGITNAFLQVQKTAKEQDVFVFYYAGHGVVGKDKLFYLVPNDVSNLNNVQSELVEKGIDSKLLQQYAVDIKAQKQLFILDACQSAGAFENMLSSSGEQQKNIAMVARSTGTHWMAASGSKQFANEFSSLGHGAFTYVLLKALQGEAASNKMITVNGLKNYLQVKVPELMKKYNGSEQYPASYGYGNDFPVEILK